MAHVATLVACVTTWWLVLQPLVAWVGASVAQVEALRADLMYLDAGLICLVPGLVLHVHGLAKKSCKSRDHFWPRKS